MRVLSSAIMSEKHFCLELYQGLQYQLVEICKRKMHPDTTFKTRKRNVPNYLSTASCSVIYRLGLRLQLLRKVVPLLWILFIHPIYINVNVQCSPIEETRLLSAFLKCLKQDFSAIWLKTSNRVSMENLSKTFCLWRHNDKYCQME